MKSTKKRNSLIKVLTILTATLFILALSVYFVISEGDFSLTGVFDKLLNGTNEADSDIQNSSNVLVNVYSVNDSFLSAYEIDTQADKIIYDFFTLYYGALGELGENELAQLYTHTSDSRVFDNFVHSYLTELRLNSTIALTYPACDVELTYEKINIDSDLLEITVNVSFTTAFDGLSNITSTLHNQRHFFILKKKSNKWLIERHEDLSGTGQYLNGILNSLIEKDGYNRNDITLSYIDKYINEMERYLKTSLTCMELNTEDESELPYFEEPYNREAAVQYALEWTDRDRIIRNLSNFTDYTNNSANFVSQCVNAGGILMDTRGTHWKWYTPKHDESEQSAQERTGYSNSWIDGSSFYEYALGNTGFGIVATSASVEETEKGDVVQFLKPNVDVFGETVLYSCLVTGIVSGYSDTDSDIELVVTGNSDDCINVPLSVLGYDTARVIKVLGCNTSDIN